MSHMLIIFCFIAGDYVMVIQETNSDWWLVRTADQRLTGLVPASYLQQLHGGIRVDYDDIDWIDSGNVSYELNSQKYVAGIEYKLGGIRI